MAAQDGRLGRLDDTSLEHRGFDGVLVVEADEPDVEERTDHEDQPRSLLELRHGEDKDDREGQEGREPVDRDAPPPVPFARGQVVLTMPEPAMVNPVNTPIA